ncbi:MAG: hypothetical protein AB7S75_17845 [Desulfococcaceae bacterium]
MRNCKTYIGIILFIVFVFGGCASQKAMISYSSGSAAGLWPDKKLEDAFSSYWWWRFQGPVEKIFSFEAPYFQEMVPHNNYNIAMTAFIRNELKDIEVYNIQKAEGAEHLYVVENKIRFVDTLGKEREMDIPDLWVYAGEKWYHVIKDPVLFPMAQ